MFHLLSSDFQSGLIFSGDIRKMKEVRLLHRLCFLLHPHLTRGHANLLCFSAANHPLYRHPVVEQWNRALYVGGIETTQTEAVGESIGDIVSVESPDFLPACGEPDVKSIIHAEENENLVMIEDNATTIYREEEVKKYEDCGLERNMTDASSNVAPQKKKSVSANSILTMHIALTSPVTKQLTSRSQTTELQSTNNTEGNNYVLTSICFGETGTAVKQGKEIAKVETEAPVGYALSTNNLYGREADTSIDINQLDSSSAMDSYSSQAAPALDSLEVPLDCTSTEATESQGMVSTTTASTVQIADGDRYETKREERTFVAEGTGENLTPFPPKPNLDSVVTGYIEYSPTNDQASLPTTTMSNEGLE